MVMIEHAMAARTDPPPEHRPARRNGNSPGFNFPDDHDTVDEPYERRDPDLRDLFSEMRASPLIRMLAVNLAGGILLATLAIGGLLVINPSGIRGLLLADGSSWLTVSLLLFGFIVTFGGIVMASAIMMMGKDD
jgi:hypothetical protein